MPRRGCFPLLSRGVFGLQVSLLLFRTRASYLSVLLDTDTCPVALQPGTYLRNTWSLFYFVGFLPENEGAILEDCWTTERFTVSLQEFAEMRLTARLKVEEPVAA